MNKKNIRIVGFRFAFASICIIFFTAIVVIIAYFLIDYKYDKAEKLQADGNYDKASKYYSELGNYKKSKEKANYTSQLSDASPNEEIIKEIETNPEEQVEKSVGDFLSLRMNQKFAEVVKTVVEVSNEENFSAPDITENDIIALDSDGTGYTVGDIKDSVVILSYEESGQDVFFAGNIQTDGTWDGKCEINVYENGNLKIASSILYEDGKKIEYKQLIVKTDYILYAERKCVSGENIGDTWKYEKADNILQYLDSDNPVIDDFIIPSEFRTYLGGHLLNRYHGATREGEYNDMSGDAYYISYNADGTVKTLYKGGFKNGQFHDETGNAWEISCDPVENVKYLYFKGVFRDGKASKEKSERLEEKNNLTIEDILYYISDEKFETVLIWNKAMMIQ